MLALKILLGLVLLIVLALWIPVGAELSFEESLTVRLKWLFLKLQIHPAKEKPAKKRAKKAQPAKAKAPAKGKKPKQKLDTQTVLEIIEFAPELLGKIGTLLSKILRCLTVKQLTLHIIVRGEDAHKTAESYGRLNAGLHGGLAVLRNFVKIRRMDIRLTPDFSGGGESEVRAYILLRAIPARLLGAAFSFAIIAAWRFLRILMKNKAQSKDRLKGGTLA